MSPSEAPDALGAPTPPERPGRRPGGHRDRDLIILVPVLDRPHRVRPLVESILATTPPCRILFIASDGYTAERMAIYDTNVILPDDYELQVWFTRRRDRGDYARKINGAVTRLHTTHDGPFDLFFGADDLEFRDGWYEAAVGAMSDQVGVVGVNDDGPFREGSPSRTAVQAGRHATHCLVADWYTRLGTIDDPARVLHEGYWHEFVDDEFTGTAQHRGAWAYVPDAHVTHLHPNLGDHPTDRSYQAARPRLAQGRRAYRGRSHLWGETPPLR